MPPAVLHPAPRSQPSACSPAASRLLRPYFAAPRLSLSSAVLPCGYIALLHVLERPLTRDSIVLALVSGLHRQRLWLLVLDRVVGSSRTSVSAVPVVYTGECDLCAKNLADGATKQCREDLRSLPMRGQCGNETAWILATKVRPRV